MLNDLETIKNYLRIDFDEDDSFLNELILISENYIDACVGTRYKNNEKGINLAKLLQKKFIAELYENRESNIANNIVRDTITISILEILNSYNYD